MMDFTITDEERLILEGLRRFNDQEAVPLEEQHPELFGDQRNRYDETGREVPLLHDLQRQVRMASARAGFFTLPVPKELGGGGQGAVMIFRIWEMLASTYGPAYELPHISIATWSSGPNPLLLGLREPYRSEVIPQLLAGAKTLAFCMSEPDAGSDAWRMTTRAVRDGDDWVINGTKQWISNGPYADWLVLFAVTDPQLAAARAGGVSCFFVDGNTPGLSKSVIRIFGRSGGHEGILSFGDVRIPGDRLMGELGEGFRLALSGVGRGRLYNCARAVGNAQWALRKATQYSQERITFGQPLAANQAISFMLADCGIEIYAAKNMCLHYAWLVDQGKRAIREMNMCKAFTTEMSYRVFDRAMQVYGGMGIVNETHLYKGWQGARASRIADGASEILRRNVARELLRGNLEF